MPDIKSHLLSSDIMSLQSCLSARDLINSQILTRLSVAVTTNAKSPLMPTPSPHPEFDYWSEGLRNSLSV
jgi:hypothetical protein